MIDIALSAKLKAQEVLEMVVRGANIILGGLTSAIYNDVVQFFLSVFGIAPLVYIRMQKLGGKELFKMLTMY